MSPSTDPFRRFNPLDESNALRVNIARLKTDARSPEFNAAIDTMIEIRQALKTLESLGRLQELGQPQFYLEALRWLHFETGISNIVAVPQITSYEMIDANIASQFRQFTQQYLQNLRANPVFSAIEAMNVSITQAITRKADEQASTIVEAAEQEVQAHVGLSLEQFRTELRNEQTAISQSIEASKVETHSYLEQEVEGATQRIRAAQSLDKWETSYDASINEYRRRLFGPYWASGTFSRNFSSVKILWRKSFKKEAGHFHASIQWLIGLVRFIAILSLKLMSNLVSLISFTRKKLGCYSGRRSLWFFVLVVFAIVYVTFSLLALLDLNSIFGHNISVFHNAHEQQPWLKLTVFLPIALILGLAYSFSIKNFRVYSNMLDQYEHRRTVAATAQGIILSLKDSGDSDLRSQVTAAASVALFEHKNTGHLTKKESETMGLLDILNTTRPKP